MHLSCSPSVSYSRYSPSVELSMSPLDLHAHLSFRSFLPRRSQSTMKSFSLRALQAFLVAHSPPNSLSMERFSVCGTSTKWRTKKPIDCFRKPTILRRWSWWQWTSGWSHALLRILMCCLFDDRVPEEIRRAASVIQKKIGDVSIIVQNAGRILRSIDLVRRMRILIWFSIGVVTCNNILDLTVEDIKRTFDVNVISHYLVSWIEMKSNKNIDFARLDQSSISTGDDRTTLWLNNFREKSIY